jgi:hypothetical protein
MTQTENQQHNSSTAAIADDVAIFTGGARGAEDTQMQAKKVDGFLGFTLMEADVPTFELCTLATTPDSDGTARPSGQVLAVRDRLQPRDLPHDAHYAPELQQGRRAGRCAEGAARNPANGLGTRPLADLYEGLLHHRPTPPGLETVEDHVAVQKRRRQQVVRLPGCRRQSTKFTAPCSRTPSLAMRKSTAS